LVRLRGAARPGQPELRFYWEQGGELRAFATGTADPTGAFVATAQVPADATPGSARVGVLPVGGAVDELAFADFRVTPPAPAGITGTVRNASGAGAGAGLRVRLLDAGGLPVAETRTDPTSRFEFAGLASGLYVVQIVQDGYPPKSEVLQPGDAATLVAEPAPADFQVPPLYLVGAGAIALPGGSFSGTGPAKVGDWGDAPFARLVSLKGKGLAPVNVRFWAEVQRATLPSTAPLVLAFQFKKGGQVVASANSATPAIVFNQSPFDFAAFTADFNSLELPPGKFTLAIRAFSTLFAEVGHWEMPVEVVDLGQRWYAGHVKSPQLKVTREDFFQLRYEFKGTLPGGLPGVGTPLFSQPFDLKFKTVQNRFDLGISLTERFYTHGGWSGQAKALAQLTLLDMKVIDESRALNLQGASLPGATYSLPPWTVPLPGGQCVPVWGAALPEPVNLCGLKFNGQVGVVLCLDGQVSLGATVHSDLRTSATVTPALNVSLPVGASLEAAICDATANIKPAANLNAPIILDPAHAPPVYWNGLCLTLSGQANLALTCCGLGFDKSVDLFDPIKIGSCPAALRVALKAGEPSLAFAPPRRASVAFSPAGFALAVWENYVTRDGEVHRTTPVYSIYDGANWSPPQPIAGEAYAGWEPRVAFLSARRAVVVWVRTNPPGGAALAGPAPHGLCGTIEDLLDYGCELVGGAVNVVESVGDFFGFARAAAGGPRPAISVTWQRPTSLTDDLPLDVRPVLAADPNSGDAVLVWLREQEPIAGRQQALALYFARRARGGWSAPERVDPLSNAFDLQPSLRFDRRGRPSLVWVRDADGDLGTPRDRRLVFSVLGTLGWSAPETLQPLPLAPWTPSLDFDELNRPLVAFVVPATDPATGLPLSGDGLLSTLHVARRLDRGWIAQPLGGETRAERPLLRVRPDNQALVCFRGFGTPTQTRPGGDVAAAVADLGADTLNWNVGRLTTDDRLNWQVAADLNPTSGEPLLVWETRDPADMSAEPELRSQPQPWIADLAFAAPELTFSQPHPTPREPVQITARLTNAGLKPVGLVSFHVSFYDREPLRGVTPFATQVVRGPLGFGEERPVTVAYTPADRAWRTFHVVVDSESVVPESNEDNNQAAAAWGGLPAPEGLAVTPSGGTGAPRLEWTNPVADGSVRNWIWRTRAGSRLAELIGATPGESFLDPLARAGEEYLYLVAAYDAAGARSTGAESVPVRAGAPEPVDSEWLRLNVVTFRGTATLTWNALPAVQLEMAESLAGGRTRWTPVTTGIEQLGGMAQFSLPAVQQQRFFRLLAR
jgi:hypothetical protein